MQKNTCKDKSNSGWYVAVTFNSHMLQSMCNGNSYIPRGFRNTRNSWCTKGHASGVMRPLCLP